MTRENAIVTSGEARIERITTRYRQPGERSARFSWCGPEESPFPEPWFCCTAFIEGGEHLKILTTGEEYLSLEQAWVLGLALSMAIDWAAEEMEQTTR